MLKSTYLIIIKLSQIASHNVAYLFTSGLPFVMDLIKKNQNFWSVVVKDLVVMLDRGSCLFTGKWNGVKSMLNDKTWPLFVRLDRIVGSMAPLFLRKFYFLS